MRFNLLMLPFIAYFASFATYAEEAMTACLDEFPPYQILGTPPKGEHVAALHQLADETNMSLRFVTEPNFSHCMKRLEQGSADVIAGILDREERRHFLHLLPMRTDTAYIFATRSDAPPIESYADLKNRLIGVSEGVHYFKQFDEDDSLTKIQLNDVHLAYKLLLARRVDVVISSMETLSTIFTSDPQLKNEITAQPYVHELDRIIYFGLSKYSPHADKIQQLRERVEKAFKTGRFEQVIQQFAAEHPQYYQFKSVSGDTY
ncbi:transporter substrate-binding domain-containing protein [Lacimicrobium sp. SS2-24]|uniref:substrate-binding periplasmic protein n=1 Tax=Lacimicrobium sp. SS2-24 TaxID=2005569 RepID=UPI000B4BF0A0|nr:transporter substrate-binding domain-containing protein [Lacimicrobium sp. SS2-24]